MRTRGLMLLVLCVAAALVFSACGGKVAGAKTDGGEKSAASKGPVQWVVGLFRAQNAQPQKGPRKETVPVRVGTVVKKQMPVQIPEVGQVEAYSTIDVKAQVSGELVDVAFKEGDVVEKDQVLFTIDPRPYEVALKQAEANAAKARAQTDQSRANLDRDKAQATNAQSEFQRDQQLLGKGMVSPEEVDSLKANAEAMQAAVTADEAAVRSSEEAAKAADVAIEDAKLQLGYCTIRSPLKGVTGSLLVHRGNLVKANDSTPLVTITQIEPIYVTFSLEQENLGVVRERMAKGPLEVTALSKKTGEKLGGGKLSFIDNTVGQQGTFRLKATFENTDGRLWPGQQVDVALLVNVLNDAVVAPTAAVQNGQAGLYVYVVKPDNTVELRNVKQGMVNGDLTVIEDGLKPDETVVTDGHLRLSPGATISIAKDSATPDKAKDQAKEAKS